MRKTILAAAMLTAAVTAGAATVAGVKLDDSVTVNNQKLVLNGAALRKKFVVKVYVGALYLTGKQSSATAILAADAPRRQVMHFLYDVDKEKMVEAWTDGLKDNTPNASPEVKTAFNTLSSWMEDMKEGQTIVMTYVPGIGTTVEVNGKTKGTLGGKAVADAILNTWIGAKPGPGGDFKKGVLGQ
ncbi:MAG TPA: chalcone isomerase family protein [Thermoanaerobaculia bacterium]|nr:chalcone isomerase family protein [Thermoanaerobaculia bacterium]